MAFSEHSRSEGRVGRLSRAGLVGALLMACALVVILARQATALRDRNARLSRAIVEPVRGMWVPTFTAATLGGDTIRVGETKNGAHQLLFVFTTTCPYCQAMIPTWAELATSARSHRNDRQPIVLGISLDSAAATRRYAETHSLPYDVITVTDRKVAALYRTQTVPLTLVIDSVGRVAHARIGEFHDELSIDSVLSVMGHSSATSSAARLNSISP